MSTGKTATAPKTYRADQVGSFLRPAELLEARKKLANEPKKLRKLEDQHILRVLDKQKELGFEIFTDGELRRSNFMSDFTDAVEGFDFGESVSRTWNTGQAQVAAVVARVTGIVNAKLRPVKRLTGHEVAFMKEHSPGAIKMTLPSATQFPAISFKWGVTDKVYKNHVELQWAVVEIMKDELSKVSAE